MDFPDRYSGICKHRKSQLLDDHMKGRFVMSESERTTVASTEPEQKRRKDLIIYPMGELAGGIYKAYFSTYISLLMTSIYLFPVTLAGVLESLQSVIGWVAAPAFGIILDRFSFKKSKYWPWYLISGAGCGILYILVFSIPVLSSNPASLAFPVACLIAIAAILAAGVGQTGLNIYASLAKGTKERAYLASASKFTRDGMKVLVGFIFPLMLAAFTNLFDKEVKAWALTAVILAGAAIILYVVTAMITRRSDLEKDAMAARALAKQKAKRTSLATVLRSIFTNPALLVSFVAMVGSKIFFFFHIVGGSYFWKYYMGNFTMMSAFFTTFSLCAILGAVVGVPLFLKFTKDTKRSYVIAFAIQAAVYACSLFIVSQQAVIQTIVILSIASFFNGITDSLILSLFAGATDYAKWKYGTAEVGLTMSCYSLGVTVGNVSSIALRTAFLAAGGFVSAELAAGGAVPAGVISALFNMNTLYPMIICIVITLLVLFIYPVNDKKLAEIRNELKVREASPKE
jgi:GPH family glycoside/pentoside/hexuronide:cation symporter